MQGQKHSIKEWAKDDRPREKLLSKSPTALSNSELLAILIGSGTRDHSAVEVAKQVLKMGGDNLQELGKLSVQDLMKINGIGQAKAITIAAALELGRRRQGTQLLDKAIITTSREVANYLQPRLRDLRHEVFGVIYCNNAGKVLQEEIISQGGLTSTVADPRLIFKKALELEAVKLILYHNHPSGSLHPSGQDKELTNKIREAARYLDIRLMDHIIVSEEGYFSFADKGLL